jgi:ABC-type sugar transport system ATPase subunit
MSAIVIQDLSKRFGGTRAVDRLSLSIRDGEFLTLLGPSGCGKTTTLRCLSGLEEPDSGEITIGGRCVFSAGRCVNVPPGQRGLGLVFQNYALWPHMKVGQNVAFGLRRGRRAGQDLSKKVTDILRVVGLSGYEDRYPHELSGGQQQRVAVARMVVTEPKIFLFDEPLSNLDAKLRMRLRSELKRLHLDLGATTVYVTHDQVEAMALSDRIVVMRDGVIQQAGTPYEVYHFPANLFVADFMGNPQTNLIPGEVGRRDGARCVTFPRYPGCAVELAGEAGLPEGEAVIVNVRPEDIEIRGTPSGGEVPFRVYTTQPMGSEVIVHLRSERGDLELMVKGPEESCLRLKPEMQVSIRLKRGNILSAATEKTVASFGF